MALLCTVCGTGAFAQSPAPSAEAANADSAAIGEPSSSAQRIDAAPARTMPFDTRAQYPKFLSNSYVGFDLGAINYAFSGRQLEPGFSAQSIDVPHAAARLVLYGHRFNRYLSAQVDYTRPVKWVSYNHL